MHFNSLYIILSDVRCVVYDTSMDVCVLICDVFSSNLFSHCVSAMRLGAFLTWVHISVCLCLLMRMVVSELPCQQRRIMGCWRPSAQGRILDHIIIPACKFVPCCITQFSHICSLLMRFWIMDLGLCISASTRSS